ncbi:MAG: amidohydrolase family protein [Verrucomicrobia bacterium]|nr:amidohydrolase family protein [Verrucomicrobiota bacterium]
MNAERGMRNAEWRTHDAPAFWTAAVRCRFSLKEPARKRPRTGAVQTLAVLAALLLSVGSTQAASTLFTGATVHTVSGETLAPGNVLVRGGKIISVSVNVAAKADRVVDLKGLHLYPGLIAVPSSLGLVEVSSVRATLDMSEVGSFNPDVRAWLSVSPDSELLPVARANGITHFLATPQGGTVSGQSGLMRINGWGMEEMTVASPVALHVAWPSAGGGGFGGRRGGGPPAAEEGASARQRRLAELQNFFDEARAYDKAGRAAAANTAAAPALNPSWEAMLPFVRGERPLMVHADDFRQIRAAVAWANTNKFRIILAGGRDAWREASLLASNKVAVIYESTFDLPNRDSESYDANFAAPAVLHRAGVKVIFSEGLGGRAASQARNLPYRAAQAVAFGLPATEALKGMTLHAAEALGVADRLGSIDAGKEASFFAMDGDVLDTRAQVRRLWLAGVEQPLDSKHTRLWQRYNSRPKPN